MADVFQWLDDSQIALLIRQLPWLFPAIEVAHIAGFIILVGGAFLFDLRLLGVAGNLSVKEVAGYVLPWSRRSLFVVIPTGFLLFISQAQALSTNGVFGLKLSLLLIAFINAEIFHRFTFRGASSETTFKPSLAARAAAIISMALWLSVITCGRWIAYV